MTTFSNNLLSTLADDPATQRFASVLVPAVPVLGRLAADAAVRAVQSLMSSDPALGLEILRENATDAEWRAIAKVLADDANKVVLRQFQNEQVLKDVLWKLAVIALGMLVPRVLP